MRATIDWSYGLLSEPEALVFEALSVFNGGCTLEEAVSVCALGGAGLDDVFALISSLVDKSLLIADADAAEPRYRMLESFRQFAREKLIERGAFDETMARHAQTFVEFAEDYERAAHESADRSWQAAARADLDNFRAALEWTLTARHNVTAGQRLAGALRRAWYFYGAVEGQRWLQSALEAVGDATPPELTAKLETSLAALCAELGEFSTALDAAMRAAGRYREIGDAPGVAGSLIEGATAFVRLARPAEAEPLLHEALEIARARGDRPLAAKASNILAWLHGKNGNFDAARASCSESLAIYEALGQANSQALTLVTLAEIEFWAGKADRAVALASDALTRGPSDGLRATAHDNLAAYHVASGRFDEAREHAREALEIAEPFGYVAQETWALQHLAAIAALQPHAANVAAEQHTRAAVLLGFVEARYAALGERPEPTDAREYETVLAALRGGLGAAALEGALDRGAGMSEEEVLAEALRV
jgi:tetratricopeptide (TPR) repeat protein